jgi:hypothetical protein
MICNQTDIILIVKSHSNKFIKIFVWLLGGEWSVRQSQHHLLCCELTNVLPIFDNTTYP